MPATMFDNIPTALADFRAQLAALPPDERYSQAAAKLWEAIGRAYFDPAGFADGKIVSVQAGKMAFVDPPAPIPAYTLAVYSPVTNVGRTAAGYGSTGDWSIALPRKTQWDFARYNYYRTITGFSTIPTGGGAKLACYNHATGVWTQVDSSIVPIAGGSVYKQWWGGAIDLSAIADEDDLWWCVLLQGNGTQGSYMYAAAVIGVLK